VPSLMLALHTLEYHTYNSASLSSYFLLKIRHIEKANLETKR